MRSRWPLQHYRGPSEQPGAGARTAPGAALGDTDNLSPIQQKLRKDNGGTKLLQGGSGAPQQTVSAFTVTDYIGKHPGYYTRAKQSTF